MISIVALAHDRDANLEFTLNCWKLQTYKEFELNIFESANLDSTIKILKRFQNDFKINCYRLHTKFVDKTKAINFLAKKSTYDIICIWDVDIVKSSEYLESCIRCLTNNNFVENYARYVNTGFTKKIFDEKLTYEQIVYWDNKFPKCFNRADAPSQICLYKKDFFAIGGYDERFFGWGSEDRDCFNRLKRFGKEVSVLELDCYHLEHSIKNNYTFNTFNSRENNRHFLYENNSNNICIVDNTNVLRLQNQWNELARPEKIEL